MTGAAATRAAQSGPPEDSRVAPRPGQGSAQPPEASPLWPLVLLLGEIAARVEREQAAGRVAPHTAAESPHDAL